MGLIIFIKNPIPGKVKTRLAATMGNEAALKVYQKLTQHTREIAQNLKLDRYLYYSDFIDQEDEWSNELFFKRRQSGQDLGERMTQAFSEMLRNTSKAVIIGSDCPLLTPAIVQEAFDQLDHFPYVLGPATDGGYYLLGMCQPSPFLFENMAWSTDQVAQITLERIAKAGQSCFVLPTLPDIDQEEDWKQYGW